MSDNDSSLSTGSDWDALSDASTVEDEQPLINLDRIGWIVNVKDGDRQPLYQGLVSTLNHEHRVLCENQMGLERTCLNCMESIFPAYVTGCKSCVCSGCEPWVDQWLESAPVNAARLGLHEEAAGNGLFWTFHLEQDVPFFETTKCLMLRESSVVILITDDRFTFVPCRLGNRHVEYKTFKKWMTLEELNWFLNDRGILPADSDLCKKTQDLCFYDIVTLCNHERIFAALNARWNPMRKRKRVDSDVDENVV